MSSSLTNWNVSNRRRFVSAAVPAGNDELLEEGLHNPLDYFLGRKGKRIRADLIEVAYRSVGGQDKPPAGVIEFVELLHAGSLIVDDIQDNSRNRRQQETLHLKFGVPVAINTGNWMYFAAMELLMDAFESPRLSVEVMKRSLSVIKQCHEGQAIDLTATFDGLEPAMIPPAVQRISELKTGALTGLAAWLGGVVTCGDRRKLEALSQFGQLLGTGLQMQNDFVELQKVAVSRFNSDDLRNRRCTWPWAWLAEAYPTNEVQRLAKLAVEQLSQPQEMAQQLLERIEIVAVNEINGKLEAALQQLDQLDTGGQVKDKMNQIVATLELHYV